MITASALAHSEGPWIVDDCHVHCTKGFVNKDPNLMFEDDVVCQVNTECRANGLLTATDKANLKLIASAPDLLSTLEAIKARIQGVWDHPSLMAKGPLMVHSDTDILEWVEEAIVKATGHS
jgi:hypothetical protein